MTNNAINTIATHYWHVLDDGRVQCDVCPRACKMHDGQQGLCFIRANQGGKVVLTSYGRSSGFCVDPEEKKPLFHFIPGTPVLSFGTVGCNLACKFCQNWDISKSREIDTLAAQAMPEKIANVAQVLNCQSVAFTYNDPTIFFEYAIDVAKACHELGIKTISVSAGYMCKEPRAEFYQHINAANIDLKGFTDEFYWKITGAHLQLVLDTLIYLKKEISVWLEITNLLIPGINDSDKELNEMTHWVVEHLGADVPVHFTAFHPDWKMTDIPATPLETLNRARRLAIKNGIRYAYTGNIPDSEGESTYCHQCKARIIGRDRYQLTEWKLNKDGNCTQCSARCAGIFNPAPGTWGNTFLPVNMSAYAA